MKKILLSVAAIALAVSAQAQNVLQLAPSSLTPAVRHGQHLMPQANDASDAQTLWWGYAHDGGYRTALGTQAAETVNQAIYIPGTNAAIVGNTIKAVRFYLRSVDNITDVKLWLSTTLPSTASAANVLVQDLSLRDLQGGDQGEGLMGLPNVVELEKPYTVTDKGVYVGYSYTVTSITENSGQYPIVLSYEDGVTNSCFLKTSTKVTNWMNAASYGPLALYVNVEGTFLGNAVSPADFGEVVVVKDGSAEAQMTVTNFGTNGISSFHYTITTDGVAGQENVVNFATPFTSLGMPTTVTIPVSADAEDGSKDKVLTITKVNGEPNETAYNTANFAVSTVAQLMPRAVAVEELTGTTCGWCPRGLVGMEKMRAAYGDKFVGIGIHQYTRSTASDAMYIASYAPVSFQGAPSCRIDRGAEMDPYYGSGLSIIDDLAAELAIPAKVGLSLKGEWNEDSTQVNATATVESVITGGNFNIEFALIADSLTGNTAAWRQYNYYHSAYGQFSGADALPEDLRFLWTTGQIFNNSYVAYYPVFNDVAIASSYVSNRNQAPAIGELSTGQSLEASYTLSLPTTAALKSAIDKKKVAVVALVIDTKSGKMTNAAKYYMGSEQNTEPDGIATTSSTQAAESARYALDGRQLQAPQKGLNIVRMADGSVRKQLQR